MPETPEQPGPREALELGPDVPPALRQAVAAALAWVDELAAEASNRAGPASGGHVAASATRSPTRPR